MCFFLKGNFRDNRGESVRTFPASVSIPIIIFPSFLQPTKCANPQCMNRTRFSLDVNSSTFVDFQKIRIQETQAELPRGSIPRTVDVIIRGEMVETVQPGDKCDIVGTLIVIPDIAQLSTPGLRAETSNQNRGKKTRVEKVHWGFRRLQLSHFLTDANVADTFVTFALAGFIHRTRFRIKSM